MQSIENLEDRMEDFEDWSARTPRKPLSLAGDLDAPDFTAMSVPALCSALAAARRDGSALVGQLAREVDRRLDMSRSAT